MTVVLGRVDEKREGPAANLGTYRALDGSQGTDLALDVDSPHAVLVVGKRGYGKSYTLGVLCEELARSRGLAPVVLDPMGAFSTLGESNRRDGTEPVPATVFADPQVQPSALDPRSWCSLLGLSPESGAGALVWGAAAATETLQGMGEHIVASDALASDRRAARNHVELARSWGVFDPDGIARSALMGGGITVLDVSGLDTAPMNAVARAVAERLYRIRVSERGDRLPWLLVDEAHAFFDDVAGPALRTILTRGRAPGVSLAVSTQRPSSLPAVAISQADVLVAHRLTAQADLDALERARPTYMTDTLEERLPGAPGEVLVVDDRAESVHAARIRRRDTPHGGNTPSASACPSGRR